MFYISFINLPLSHSFFQIENFAAVERNYAYLSRYNYGKMIQRKNIPTLFTSYKQHFTVIISAKSLISFETLLIIWASMIYALATSYSNTHA